VVARLALALGSRRVGLATDVAGVLRGGSVIPRIDREILESLDIGGSAKTDVTGGMRGKIAELLILADAGIDSEIFHDLADRPVPGRNRSRRDSNNQKGVKNEKGYRHILTETRSPGDML